MWFTLAKVWLSLWITMIGLIEAGNEPTSNTVSTYQTCFCQRSRMSCFCELPDLVLPEIADLAIFVKATSTTSGSHTNRN